MVAETKVYIIIPARGGSKRLKKKNIYPVLGKPMITWVIEECKKLKNVDFKNVYVTSEDLEIIDVVTRSGVKSITRPKTLSGDHVEKMDAIQHAVKTITSIGGDDIVVSLQANSPTFLAKDLDDAILFFKENLFFKKKKCEVISVGKDMLQNACFRIMSYEAVFHNSLSTNIGVFFTDCHDVHDKQDVKHVEKILRDRNEDKNIFV